MADQQRKRKVRKGTHSCWECRRRKIRCQYGSDEDTVCLPCQARGTQCRSQEFPDESQAQRQPDRRLAQRLGRLEELMGKLVDKIMPEAKQSSKQGDPRGSEAPSMSSDDDMGQDGLEDGPETSVVDENPVGLLLGLRHAPAPSLPQAPSDMLTPESYQSTHGTSPGGTRQEKISKKLYALFPSQQDVQAIVEASGGTHYLIRQFYDFNAVLEGRAELPVHLATIPPASSHPTVLARRLLQLCICMQQLLSNVSPLALQSNLTIANAMATITSTVTDLVVSDDEVVATVEGVQCLIMLGMWQSNAGNLRKAWLSFRRALSFAQLLGIDRGSSQALKFADSDSDSPRPQAETIWFRTVANDRSLSLLLGLPVGSTDDGFASDEAMQNNTQLEKLEKLHTVASGRIAERNASKTSHAYALTQSIDYDLGIAAQAMGQEWWIEPALSSPDQDKHPMGNVEQLMLQVQHYDLLILLHLPYMLRDATETKYDYSKASCTSASREVLRRFISFRDVVSEAHSCRHVDYSALIAAMTLLLTYLRQSPTQAMPSCSQRDEDRKLVEVVRERMQHIAVLHSDKLSEESANVLEQMTPILDSVDAMMKDVSELDETAVKCMHLTVPYLGIINILPSAWDKGTTYGQLPPGAGATPLYSYTTNQGLASAADQPVDAAAAISESMNFTSLNSTLLASSGMHMELELQSLEGGLEFPGATAEADDWAFQGVDTTYWSLLNSSTMGFEP